MMSDAAMSWEAVLKVCHEKGDFQPFIEKIPYARLLGIQVVRMGEEILFKLPAKESNIGNPTLPAIHGGVLGGFVEHAAIVHVMMLREHASFPRIIDLSIDYLSAGHFRDTYAECRILRLGRRIANVSVDAWQTSRARPIATARAHMLLE
ncbi:Thioesterase superfamily [gamma proteobacterium HdN1]|nr:Thioesterase superfamily [gamma proteobacterium HdN1]